MLGGLPNDVQDIEAADKPANDELPASKEQFCANHPGRATMVTCSACGKPLCPDCMVYLGGRHQVRGMREACRDRPR